MTEHFTRSTVSASFWCSKCKTYTLHRIDDRRKGPCLKCCTRLDKQHADKPKVPKAEEARQRELWEDAG